MSFMFMKCDCVLCLVYIMEMKMFLLYCLSAPLLKACITRVRLVFSVGEDYLLGDCFSVINTIYR